jgi:hypothetical protein
MVEEARNLLRQAVRVDEAKRIRDQGQAIKVYLRAQKAAKSAIDDAGEIILQATRRMGELLKEQKRTGKRASRNSNLRKGPKSQAATSESPPTLEDLGLTRSQASRAQQLADIPEETVTKYVEERRADAARSITVSGLIDEHEEPEPDAPDPVDDVVDLYLTLSYADRARFHERIDREFAA